MHELVYLLLPQPQQVDYLRPLMIFDIAYTCSTKWLSWYRENCCSQKHEPWIQDTKNLFIHMVENKSIEDKCKNSGNNLDT